MRTFIPIALAASLALAGCGGDSGTVEGDDGKAIYEAESDGGTSDVRFTDGEGNETVVNSGEDVAATLPDGFSIYPGAEVVSNTTMSGAEGEGMMVTLSSQDSAEQLVSHYKSEAEAAGIDLQMELTSGNTRMIGGESEDGRFFSFNASSEGDTTTGMLMVGGR